MNVELLVKATSLDQNLSDLVRITIGGWSTIFKVAFVVFGHVPWNADGAASVGDSGREVVNGGCFMETGKTTLVVLALVGVIGLDVTNVMAGQLVNGCLNLNQTIIFTHFQCRKVGVSASSVPITLHWFGIHRNNDTKIFSGTMKEEPAHPKIVTH